MATTYHLAISPARFDAESQAIYRDIEEHLSGLSEADFNWQPDGGRGWSVGQNLAHLTKGNDAYVDAMTKAIERARPRADRAAGVPNAFGRWFVRELEPPVKRRMRAPGVIQPASNLDPAATRAAFDASVDRVRALLDRAWEIDLNRTRFRNPLAFGLPLFNISAGFLILLAHMRRHVAQARKVRAC
jgi:hypothetical protein